MFTPREQNMPLCSRIWLCGSMLLIISITSSPSKAQNSTAPATEEIPNKTEQRTDPLADADESTQRILPNETPKIDEFYPCEYTTIQSINLS